MATHNLHESTQVRPHELRELRRLQTQHEWVKGCAGGLLKAPLDITCTGLRILDAATADGFWIKDMISRLPQGTEFVGFDVAPYPYPAVAVAPNVQLEIQDLREPSPSSWNSAFDLVHQRFVISDFEENEVQQLIQRLANCIKPGGWIQLVEADFGACVSTPADEIKAFRMIHTLTGRVMADHRAPIKLPACVEAAGMTKVSIQIIDMVAGKAHPDAMLGQYGSDNLQLMFEYYHSLVMPEEFGFSETEWKGLPKTFSQDMEKFCTTIRHYFIWAQKPPA